MEWYEIYNKNNQPTLEQISDFINNSLWEKFNEQLQSIYQIQPKLSYSSCSMQAGWNLKYQKSGKALCTLYPMSGFFIALVVVGNNEMAEAELLIPTFSTYVKTVFQSAVFSAGGKWLMLKIADEKVLDDVIGLIKLRIKPKNR